MCQSKFCTTVVGTSCKTIPKQIEVKESLEGYSQQRVTKLWASTTTRSTVVGVIHRLDRRRVLFTTSSTCRGGNFGAKFQWEAFLFVEVPEYPYNTV